MKKIIPVVAFILLGLSIALSSPCDKTLSCRGPLSDSMAYPGLWFLIMIFISLFALSLNNQKHKIWLIFTGIFFILSMIIVFMTPEYGSGLVTVDRELTNWFLAGLYSFLSIVYFIVQYFKSE